MGSDNARRVLLCEDEADLADHLANYLQMHARICRDGPGAIKEATKWRPSAASSPRDAPVGIAREAAVARLSPVGRGATRLVREPKAHPRVGGDALHRYARFAVRAAQIVALRIRKDARALGTIGDKDIFQRKRRVDESAAFRAIDVVCGKHHVPQCAMFMLGLAQEACLSRVTAIVLKHRETRTRHRVCAYDRRARSRRRDGLRTRTPRSRM